MVYMCMVVYGIEISGSSSLFAKRSSNQIFAPRTNALEFCAVSHARVTERDITTIPLNLWDRSRQLNQSMSLLDWHEEHS